jgi:hypothetical protein
MGFSTQILKGSFVLTLSISLLVLSAHSGFTAGKSRVFFTSPADKATVSSPVKATMGAESFTIEPAGEVKPGAGHLHIMVDTDCVAAGQAVPKDDTHLHFGKGQTDAELKLSPGTHTLCLQAGDGAHVAVAGEGMTQKITITVK